MSIKSGERVSIFAGLINVAHHGLGALSLMPSGPAAFKVQNITDAREKRADMPLKMPPSDTIYF